MENDILRINYYYIISDFGVLFLFYSLLLLFIKFLKND